ncbi:hypothetical protein [Cellulomonas sp. NS3]|uniref:hypothetical protein n=1 Tax=Cellulomonas sp. NS3 TaxID=2973977 RepID=UPI002161ECBE|nr:hypothetical protein [Cellulomonas sp. NS3]
MALARTEADVVAAAVLACPAVVGLRAGGGLVATYLPGRRVDGVRIGPDAVEVSLVARLGVPVPTLDAQVRAALAPHARGRAVHLHVEDVLDSVRVTSPDPASPAAAGV